MLNSVFEETSGLGPFAINRFGDRYLYEVNRTAFDTVGSDALYKKTFGDGLFKENSLNIIIGTDSGLLPAYVLRHGIPKRSRFLFIEIPEVLAYLKKSRSISFEDPCMAATTLRDWKEIAKDFDLTAYIYTDGVLLRQSIGAADAHVPAYHDLYWSVYEELTGLIWETKASLGTRGFVIRQLENLAENRLSSICLENVFNGKSAFLLAGGPSLDGALSWLKEHRDQVIIIAVSRICRRLRQVGLIPHIVFSVDPNPVSFDISKDLFYFWPDTLFIHAYHVSSRLLAQWPGTSLFLGPRLPWNSPLNVRTLPCIGPTVTNAAIDSAVAMGFVRIFLAGVDLCFSREGYSHAKGSDEYKAGPVLNRPSAKVETNSGAWAETRPDYATAIQIIAHQAETAKKNGCKLINTSPAAAKIPNVSYEPLSEVTLFPLTEKVDNPLADLIPQDHQQKRIDHYEQMLKEVRRATSALKKIGKLAKEGLKCNLRFFSATGGIYSTNDKEKMEKIEDLLNSKYKEFVPLAKEFGIHDFIRIIRPNDDDDWNAEETMRVGNLYYQSLYCSSTQLVELLEKAEQRLLSRLEEEKPCPNMSLLIRQWETDGQPGRGVVWKSLHQDSFSRLPANDRKRLEDLEQRFHKILGETETVHLRLMKKTINLTGVRGKIALLFKKKNIGELEKLVRNLSLFPNHKAKSLLKLATGYLSELRSDPKSALLEYEKIISDQTDRVLIEDALRRIVHICIDLKDTNNALTALQCLTALSRTYCPPYAELLRLTGDLQGAAQVYTDYLTKCPEDSVAMLKLGKIYQDLHVDEAARMAFRYVLEQDPQNTGAKTLLESMQKTTS